MLKKIFIFLLFTLVFVNTADAREIHNTVSFINNSPDYGPMTVTYKIIENSSSPTFDANKTSIVNIIRHENVDFVNKDNQTITIVPINVNGHSIENEKDAIIYVKKPNVCAITLNADHSTGSLKFTEIHKGKHSYYITCSVVGSFIE